MFSRSGHRPDQALAAAILGHIGDAQALGLAGARDPDLPAVDQHLAAIGRPQPEDRLGELAAPRPDQAREAHHLARAQHQVHVVEARMLREAADLEQRLADLRLELGEQVLDPAADHHVDEIVLAHVGNVSGRDIGAVAQHRDPVGEHEDLLEAVADVDDADAALAQQADDAEQAHDVRLGQRRGRLVHDQDAGVLRERLGDLDPLPVADRERADQRARGRDRGCRARRAARAPWRASPPSRSPPKRVRGAWPMKMFSATVSSGKQQQLLEDRGDAAALGVVRVREAHDLAVQADGAGVGLVDAGDDLDQRRLAGAVLAEQRMHLAGADVEADPVQRAHAGKRLGDLVER